MWFSASILTKSDLVARDIDLLGNMSDSAVSVSVAFTDNQIRKMFEANTTEKRIEALKRLKEADKNRSIDLSCYSLYYRYITTIKNAVTIYR